MVFSLSPFSQGLTTEANVRNMLAELMIARVGSGGTLDPIVPMSIVLPRSDG